MIPPTSHATAERHQSPVTDIEPHRPRPLLPVIRSSRSKLAKVPLADLILLQDWEGPPGG